MSNGQFDLIALIHEYLIEVNAFLYQSTETKVGFPVAADTLTVAFNFSSVHYP